MGFTLQSFPPDSGTALSSRLVTTSPAYRVSAKNCRLSSRQIVKPYKSENSCGPTNTPIMWSAPRSVHILHQCYPIQAVDAPLGSTPSREYHQLTLSARTSSRALEAGLQAGVTLHFRVLRVNWPESLPKKKIHPS